MKLIHGGDIAGFKEQYGFEPIDFSVNTNPLGMPGGAMAAAKAALEEAGSYPDPLCRELCAAIGEAEGLAPEQVICGGGAADVIFRLVLAARPRRAMVTAPSFAEYENALAACGCAVEHHVLRREQGFRPGPELLKAVGPGLDMLFLCEPNNPTGQLSEPALLQAVLEKCAAAGTLLVVDECFNGFLPDAAARSLAPKVPGRPGLFVLRAFTKLYAMAGLRLGYGLCSNAALLEKMRAAGQPWPVSSVASAAGLAALEDTAYLEETRRATAAERAYLAKALDQPGLRVLGGSANYLFFHTGHPDFFDKLARRGFLLRDCANYKGLAPGYYRAALRCHADNARLAAAVAEILAGGQG